MDITWVRRGTTAALVGSLAMAGVLVGQPTANAAAEDGVVDPYIYFSGADSTTGCTVTPALPSHKNPVLTDNGAWVSDARSGKATLKTKAGAVVATFSASSSVQAKITPLTGGPARFDAVLNATASRTAGRATGCYGGASAYPEARFEYTLTAPMWVTAGGSSVSGKGSIAINVAPDDVAADGAAALVFGGKSSGGSTALLQPGKYWIDASGSAYVGSGTGSQSISGSLWATFTPVGYASSAQSGRARRFVTFAGARDCAHAALGTAVTKKARRKAAKVVLKVNGHKRLVLKGKRLKRTSSVVLGGLAPGATTLTAVVTPKRGKKVTTSRSYLACS